MALRKLCGPGGKVFQWENKQENFQSALLASAARSPNSKAQNFEYEIYIPLKERKTNSAPQNPSLF